MDNWFKARLESILDNLIFAGAVAGGAAVLASIPSLPIPIIIGISSGAFILVLVIV